MKRYQAKIVLSRQQKAKELNITLRTLERWIKQNKIEHIIIPGSNRKWFLPEVKNVYIEERNEKENKGL